MKGKYLFAALASTFAIAACSSAAEGTQMPPAPPVTNEQPQAPAPPPVVTDTDQSVATCVDLGQNPASWNTLMDVPSEDELRLAPADRGKHFQPMVDAPLVEVRAWSGPCHDFDTVEFIIDTSMNDPEYYNRPWFNVGYENEVRTEGKGDLVELEGDANLRVTVYARAASFVHSSGHVPPGLVNASAYDRLTNFNSVRQIKGAGEYEGQFTFGVGVDKERPFAVHFHEYGDKTVVVIRVAHRDA